MEGVDASTGGVGVEASTGGVGVAASTPLCRLLVGGVGVEIGDGLSPRLGGGVGEGLGGGVGEGVGIGGGLPLRLGMLGRGLGVLKWEGLGPGLCLGVTSGDDESAALSSRMGTGDGTGDASVWPGTGDASIWPLSRLVTKEGRAPLTRGLLLKLLLLDSLWRLKTFIICLAP